MLNKQIIIGGFHRSGTSFLARVLHDAGLNMGDKMLGARASNIHGHYEDIEIVKIHNQILRDNGISWMEDRMRLYRFSDEIIIQLKKYINKRDFDHDSWGFKDPRTCLFLMLWKMLIPNMKIVIVYRHYVNCYKSLNKRHISQLFNSQDEVERNQHLQLWSESDIILKMWLTYNKHLLNFAQTFPDDVIVISYEDVLTNKNIISQISNKWNLNLKTISMENYVDSNLVDLSTKDKVPCSSSRISNEVNITFNKLQELKEAQSLWMTK